MTLPGSSTVRRMVGGGVALVLFAALLALGAQPTGSPSPEATVSSDARVAARRDVGSVAVMLIVSRGDVALVVAYHESKGWFAAPVDPVPRSVETSWTSTRGGGVVPALSAAYGRATVGKVRVTWSDNASETVTVASDGMWLAARQGQVQLARVERLALDGTVTSVEPGL
jgi:hypothetical protein